MACQGQFAARIREFCSSSATMKRRQSGVGGSAQLGEWSQTTVPFFHFICLYCECFILPAMFFGNWNHCCLDSRKYKTKRRPSDSQYTAANADISALAQYLSCKHILPSMDFASGSELIPPHITKVQPFGPEAETSACEASNRGPSY